jgi:hypothetical protein
VGFKILKPRERVAPYRVFFAILEVVYIGFTGDNNMYVGFIKERHVHLENHAIFGSHNRAYFAIFFCSRISLNGPLSLLWEP